MDFGHLNTWLYGLFGMITAGVVYLIRTIFTNQKQIEMLQQKLELYEAYRRQRETKLDNQLLEIRTDIKALMKKE